MEHEKFALHVVIANIFTKKIDSWIPSGMKIGFSHASLRLVFRAFFGDQNFFDTDWKEAKS